MILLFFRDELLVKNKYAGYYRGKHFFELKKYKTYLACCVSLIKKKKKKRQDPSESVSPAYAMAVK